MTENLTIEDLEKHSGLSIRTLRYYMSIGLLPGPDTLGKYASYSQEHLDRLDLILILKTMYLPLDEIRALLDQMTPEEIRHYCDEQEDLAEKIKAFKPEPESPKRQQDRRALDYIKSLEEAHASYDQLIEDRPSLNYQNKRVEFTKIGADTPVSQTSQETWQRYELFEGVELHVRETKDQAFKRKVDRLLSFARSLFRK